MLSVRDFHNVNLTSSSFKHRYGSAVVYIYENGILKFFRRGIQVQVVQAGWNRNGWDLFWEKMPILHSGYSLCVEAVPYLQRSQPGSEQAKLTAERRMQQNKTST